MKWVCGSHAAIKVGFMEILMGKHTAQEAMSKFTIEKVRIASWNAWPVSRAHTPCVANRVAGYCTAYQANCMAHPPPFDDTRQSRPVAHPIYCSLTREKGLPGIALWAATLAAS